MAKLSFPQPKNWKSVLLCLLLNMAFNPAFIPVDAASNEYQIKAVFLFNFAQFVEWPAASFANANTPLCIGVLGKDPFGASLDEAIRGETVHNRKLIVQRSQKIDDLKSCHMIFISKSEEGRITEILSNINSASILTVSETNNFAQRGGILNFFLEGKKVRFEINPSAAQHQNLKVSSELLSLGKIVSMGPSK